MAKVDMTREDYINSEQAAVLLKYKCPRQARKALIKGGVRPIRIGYKKILFLRTEVNRFLNQRAMEGSRTL